MESPSNISHIDAPESEDIQVNPTLKEGAQYFRQCRFAFLILRVIQCVTATVILFFPRTAFRTTAISNRYELLRGNPNLLINFGFNLGIASGALLHNLICYVVYSIDQARLPFFIYAAIVDFVASNAFLGLLLTSIIRGGLGTGVVYQVLCVLAWASFAITSFMEISLVCVFNYLHKSLEPTTTPASNGRSSMTVLPRGPIIAPQREKPRRARRAPPNVTVETVDDSTDNGRTTEQQSPTRRPETAHLSQATTIAEILQEAVEDTLDRAPQNPQADS